MNGKKPPFDLNDFRPPNSPERVVRMVVIGLLAVGFLFSSWFTIEPEEVGIVLRFGEYSRTANPGLNFKIPFGIESVQKVPVERQEKEEFGFRTVEAGTRTVYSNRNFDDEALMLTGDLNAADVTWIVQYRISDAYKFLFKVRNVKQTFRDMNEAIVREVVGDRSIDEVLNVRGEIETTVQQRLQDLCDQYEMGIKIEQIQLQDVTPPDPVKAAFNEVNEAEQEKESLINQAKAEYNKVIPRASGEAARTIEEARGYAQERVNNAEGDAARFNALFREYSKAKEVTRQRIYLETMDKVLKRVGKKLITDDQGANVLPLLNIDKDGGK